MGQHLQHYTGLEHCDPCLTLISGSLLLLMTGKTPFTIISRH